MPDEVDAGYFLYAMNRTARLWRRQLDAVLAHYGLTEAQTRPLIYIDRLGDGIRHKDLAVELEMEGSALVRVVNSLEKAGLICRRIGVDDRRERYLYLTTAGRAMVVQVRRLTERLHHHILAVVSAQDQCVCLSAFAGLDEVFESSAAICDGNAVENSQPIDLGRRRAGADDVRGSGSRLRSR